MNCNLVTTGYVSHVNAKFTLSDGEINIPNRVAHLLFWDRLPMPIIV
jgi:hypothetical protein